MDLNLAFFYFTRTKWDFDVDEGDSLSTVGFGPVPSPRLGIGVGFSANGNVSAGVRLMAGVSTRRWANADGSEDGDEHYLLLDYAVLPYFEYAFGSRKIRPFVTVALGLDGTYERYESSDQDFEGDYTTKSVTSTNLAVVGFGFGMHFFLAPSVSLDLWLLESVGVGSIQESYHWESSYYSDTEDDKTFVWRTRTELFLGLSAWI
jgi:hypothetical protein